MKQTNSQCQLYNTTSFFVGFRAKVTTLTHTNLQPKHNARHMTMSEVGEKLLITDTTDPDNWSAVSVDNPARAGLVSRKNVTMDDIRLEPWFFPELPTQLTTSVLKRQGPGSFLLRTQKRKFLLSHMSDRTVYHTWIHQSESGRYYVNSRRRFSTVHELIDFCRKNHVNGMRLEKYPTKKNIEDALRLDVNSQTFNAQKEIRGKFPWTIEHGDLLGRGQVALHTLKKSASVQDALWLQSQASVLMCLDHENLVKLIGLGESCMALQLKSPVTLSQYLLDVATSPNVSPRDLAQFRNDREVALLDIATEICAGMAYLEKRGIVHNELIADNCLLEITETKTTVTITGFHNARFTDDPSPPATRHRPRTLLPAPELSTPEPSSSMSDVWDYGVLLWMMFSDEGGELMKGKKERLTLDKLSNSAWKNLYNGAEDMIHQIATACLYKVPQIRPTFNDNLRQYRSFPAHDTTLNDESVAGIHVSPVLFGIETFEIPENQDDLNESNSYFGEKNGLKSSLENDDDDIKFFEMDTPSQTEINGHEDSFWSNDDPFDSGSPEFEIARTTAKRQLTFEEPMTSYQSAVTPNNTDVINSMSSDSGCSLTQTQSRLRRIRSVGDEFQNLKSLCKTYREMFENAKTENDTLIRRIEELERQAPVKELEKRLSRAENELIMSQRECKKLRDRNKMLERSFCENCKGELSDRHRAKKSREIPRSPPKHQTAECYDIDDVTLTDDVIIAENVNVPIKSSLQRTLSVSSTDSCNTLHRAMSQFEKENLKRRERLRSIRNGHNDSLNDSITSECSIQINEVSSSNVNNNNGAKTEDSQRMDTEQSFVDGFCSPDFSTIRRQPKHSLNQSVNSMNSEHFRSSSGDSAIDSFRNDSYESVDFRENSRLSLNRADLVAAQKLIRDNLEHHYLRNHTHISTIADDGVSKVTLF